MKHSVAFSGGTVSAATINLQVGARNSQTFDVFQAVGDTVGIAIYQAFQGNNYIQEHANVSDIDVRLILTGDTGDNLTAGAVEIWVQTLILPSP